MKKSLLVAVLLIAASFGLLANGQSDANSGNGTASQSYKIAYLPTTVGQALTKAWGVGVERAIKESGMDVQYQAFDGQMKAEIQVTMMDDIINQGYDAIILQPVDSAALTASVIKAEKKGIYVITLNTDTKAPHAACVSMDDFGAGKLVGQTIAKALNGKGNVALIQSPPGALAGVEREKGFREAMADFPGIEIVGAQNGEWNKDKSIAIMNSFLQVNEKLDAVFAVNDNMAEGAMIAAESAGRLDNIMIWGFNGQMSTLKLIAEGKVTGTAYTNAYAQGGTAAKYAMDLLTGNKKEAAATEEITVPPFAAMQDTVGQIADADRW